jgi:5,10-methylenetetrahydrofolate reductase
MKYAPVHHKLVSVIDELKDDIIGVFEFNDSKIHVFVGSLTLPKIHNTFRRAKCSTIYTEDSFYNIMNKRTNHKKTHEVIGTHLEYETMKPMSPEDMVCITTMIQNKEWYNITK